MLNIATLVKVTKNVFFSLDLSNNGCHVSVGLAAVAKRNSVQVSA